MLHGMPSVLPKLRWRSLLLCLLLTLPSLAACTSASTSGLTSTVQLQDQMEDEKGRLAEAEASLGALAQVRPREAYGQSLQLLQRCQSNCLPLMSNSLRLMLAVVDESGGNVAYIARPDLDGLISHRHADGVLQAVNAGLASIGRCDGKEPCADANKGYNAALWQLLVFLDGANRR